MFSITQRSVTSVTRNSDGRHLHASSSGSGIGSGRGCTTAVDRVLDDERLSVPGAAEQLEDERFSSSHGPRIRLGHRSGIPQPRYVGSSSNPSSVSPSSFGSMLPRRFGGQHQAPRRNASRSARSNPSRSRRNARTGVRATTLALRGTSRAARSRRNGSPDRHRTAQGSVTKDVRLT